MNKNAMTDFEIEPLMAARWSPRAFEAAPVDHGQLKQCLEAARWAASCYNDQPWSFIVVPRDDEGRFKAAVECLAGGNQTWATNAGALLFALVRSNFKHSGGHNRHADYDLGQAVAQFTLQATSLGLSVHQMGGFAPDAVRETFEVPETHAPLVAIAIGKLASPEVLPEELRQREVHERSRRPQSEFVHWGLWSS
jgi:nitroreductase